MYILVEFFLQLRWPLRRDVASSTPTRRHLGCGNFIHTLLIHTHYSSNSDMLLLTFDLLYLIVRT